MASLSQKAASGIFWSATQRFGEQGVQFIVGIVLARILAPEQFGLLAMAMVFVAIGTGVTDAGFSSAVIQRQNLTQRDLSSVFYFNLFLGLLTAGFIWLVAPEIAGFYRMEELTNIVRVIAIAILLNALGQIHLSQLSKALKFRSILLASFPAICISGIVAIYLALTGWGVWALVVKALLQQTLTTTFLWLTSPWRPTMEFSSKSILSMLPYGSRLAVSGFLDRVFQNIYVLVIGRAFSAVDVGFYQRANQFKQIGAQNISGIVGRVMFPVYSTIQGDPVRLKRVFEKSLTLLALITFPLMALMAGIAESMILVLIGEPWLPAVPFLQILCIAGALYPIHSANLSILKALGHSKLFLRLEIIKKVLILAILMVTIHHGIIAILWGQVFFSFIALWINAYYSRRFIAMSYREQVMACKMGVSLAIIVGGAAFTISAALSLHQVTILALSLLQTGGILIIAALLLKNRFKAEFSILRGFIKKH